MKSNVSLLLLFLLLTGCATGQVDIPSIVPPEIPTLTNIPLPTPTITPLPTRDVNTLPANCMDEGLANGIVEGWLQRMGYATLRDAWLAFMEATGEGDILTSSTTDYDEQIAYAVTWRKMLLVGEYPFRVDAGGRQGIGYCSVLIYPGGMGPEVGMGITDISLGGEWSGFASGLVTTEQGTRDYLTQRVGMPVTVRYMVAQNPQDGGFVKPGFFSPVMQQLWNGSYYTRIPGEMNILTGMVGQPRGPSIREMMAVATALQGQGVFMEYVVDMVPQR